MLSRQQKILLRARRFRLFYPGPSTSRENVIPDTPLALKWAVGKCGAVQISALSFHRYDPDGALPSYQVGDFYFRLVNHLNAWEAEPLLRWQLETLFNKMGLNSPQFLRFYYVSDQCLGIRIDAQYFGKRLGFQHLDIYYKKYYEHLKRWVREMGLQFVEVQYDGHMDIANVQRDKGRFCVPVHLDELIGGRRQSFDQLSRNPRFIKTAFCEEEIDPGFDKILVLAMDDAGANPGENAHRSGLTAFYEAMPNTSNSVVDASAGHDGKADWPHLRPLHEGASRVSNSAMSCATRLAAWLRDSDIHEFRRYHALRAVTGSFKLHGRKNSQGGVLDALSILKEHGFIVECPSPSFRYPCKRMSPWFLVNPAVFNRF